jgi:hypothetical protein
MLSLLIIPPMLRCVYIHRSKKQFPPMHFVLDNSPLDLNCCAQGLHPMLQPCHPHFVSRTYRSGARLAAVSNLPRRIVKTQGSRPDLLTDFSLAIVIWNNCLAHLISIRAFSRLPDLCLLSIHPSTRHCFLRSASLAVFTVVHRCRSSCPRSRLKAIKSSPFRPPTPFLHPSRPSIEHLPSHSPSPSSTQHPT